LIDVRSKGRRTEYEVRDILKANGISADRVPLSGASQGFKGDIIFIRNDKKYVGEVKARQDSFKEIYKEIDNYDLKMGNIIITTLERWLMNEKKEIKEIRKSKLIEKWLIDRDVLFFKSNRKDWLIAYASKV